MERTTELMTAVLTKNKKKNQSHLLDVWHSLSGDKEEEGLLGQQWLGGNPQHLEEWKESLEPNTMGIWYVPSLSQGPSDENPALKKQKKRS